MGRDGSGTHSIWISAQLQELGHEVIVANIRELRAISHSDRKSDQVDAERSWRVMLGLIRTSCGRSPTALSSKRRPAKRRRYAGWTGTGARSDAIAQHTFTSDITLAANERFTSISTTFTTKTWQILSRKRCDSEVVFLTSGRVSITL